MGGGRAGEGCIVAAKSITIKDMLAYPFCLEFRAQV